MDGREFIVNHIRRHGPITVAAFMRLALYDDEYGYYTRATRRSGRAGDFFTSVDVGPLFGELLAEQFLELWHLMGRPERFDLAEAAAGSGRLAADILTAASRTPGFYAAIRLHLIESSPSASAAQRATLGDHASKLASSAPTIPGRVEGVLFANELLDALPVHQVVMGADGLREVFVDVEGGRLLTRDLPVSTSELADYLDRLALRLESGWRAEIGLAADAWVRVASRALVRGVLLLIDYGHQARDLYSAAHASGTLTTFTRHVSRDPGDSIETARRPAWLDRPGEQDITAHVDFTTIRAAAEAEGLETLGFMDQTYFLLGLGAADRVAPEPWAPDHAAGLERRLALKTLVLPGGLGSTHKVLLMGRGIGRPKLRAVGFGARVT